MCPEFLVDPPPASNKGYINKNDDMPPEILVVPIFYDMVPSPDPRLQSMMINDVMVPSLDPTIHIQSRHNRGTKSQIMTTSGATGPVSPPDHQAYKAVENTTPTPSNVRIFPSAILPSFSPIAPL